MRRGVLLVLAIGCGGGNQPGAHPDVPSCSYTLYGPACFPETSMLGVDIYTKSYGSIDPAWKPTGC